LDDLTEGVLEGLSGAKAAAATPFKEDLGEKANFETISLEFACSKQHRET